VPAVQELLIDRFVATPAVARREFRRNYKPVMVLFVLPGCRLMAIKTSYAFGGVLAQLIFVHHGILSTGMTFSTLAGGPNKLSAGLLGLAFRTCTVHQKSRQH
jgi:hypothetical protein